MRATIKQYRSGEMLRTQGWASFSFDLFATPAQEAQISQNMAQSTGVVFVVAFSAIFAQVSGYAIA